MKNLTLWKNFLAAATLTVGVVGLARADIAVPPVPPAPAKPPFADPQDAIVARHAAFKSQGDIFGALKKTLDAGEDTKPFSADAKWLVAWSKQIPEMFPKGSDTGHDTKALPAIWTDKDTFDKDAAAYGEAVTKLAALIDAGDKEGVAKQFGATGATCGACHRAFRAKLQ
jgi:cytochrome c556